MNYALVNSYDTKESYEFYCSKHIKQGCIFQVGNLNKLSQIVSPSDTIFVFDVNRFESVSLLCDFYQFCVSRKVNFISISNPYLNWSEKKPVKESYLVFIRYMVAMEKGLIESMLRSNKGCDRNLVYTYVSRACIDIVGQVFSRNGINKKTP